MSLILEKPERLVEWNLWWNDALEAHAIKQLEVFQLTRLSRRTKAGEGRQWHQPVCRSRDVHLRKLIGRQTLCAFNLWNDLVTSPLDAEAVDVVSADER